MEIYVCRIDSSLATQGIIIVLAFPMMVSHLIYLAYIHVYNVMYSVGWVFLLHKPFFSMHGCYDTSQQCNSELVV